MSGKCRFSGVRAGKRVHSNAITGACTYRYPIRILPLLMSMNGAAMIPRYARPEMAELSTDQARYAAWTRGEVLATQAQANLGKVPATALDDIRRARVPAAARVAELERE